MPADATRHVLMVAYTIYPSDARVRREAETIAALEGYAVAVMVLKEQARARHYMLDGVEIVELDIPKYRGKRKLRYFFSYLHYLLLSLMEITRRFARGRVATVHVHNMPNFLVMAAIIPKLFRRPLILDIHDSMPETYAAKFSGKTNSLFMKLLVLEERISAKLADRIICVNHVQKRALTSHGLASDHVTVVLNAPDPRRFRAVPRTKNLSRTGHHFNIVYHGTITKRLGIDIALQAIHRLRSQITGIRFHVLGTGEDLHAFKRLSSSLGLGARVQFNGRMLPVEKLLAALEEMDLGLISNRQNIATDLMLPVKMLEYFALGIPVVAPALPAIEYYCDAKMVSFYRPEDIDSMAGAIYNLYANPSRREQQAEKAGRFLDRYGWEKHKAKLIQVYET